MDTQPDIRLRVIAADDPASARLIGALRQDGLLVTASGQPGAATHHDEFQAPSWEVLLIVEHPRLAVDAILARVAQSPARYPVLLAVQDAGGDGRGDDAICDRLPRQDLPGLLRAIRLHGAHQRTLRCNHRLKRQLRDLSRRQQSLLDHSSQGIAIVKDGIHRYCNRAYAALFGEDDCATLTGSPLAGFIDAADRARLARLLDRPGRDRADLVCSNTGGRLRFSCQPTVHAGDQCLQLTVMQAPGNQAYARRKQHMAGRDLITRLDNLPGFRARLESAIAAAIDRREQSVLLVVRIDRFARVRQALGQAGTNAVLAEIADFLNRAISKPFTASRLAGDEFGLLLSGSTTVEGIELADYIRDRVGKAVATGADTPARISVTVGLAALNERALDADAMLSRARMNGKPAGEKPACAADMAGRVRHALKDKRLGLVYQPVLALHEDDRERYEVLLRLEDGGAGLTPETFLHHANIHNLGEAVDRAVLTMLLARPALVGHGKRDLLIHLTGNTLANLTLLPWLNKRLGRCPHLADRLIILVNEIDLANDAGQVRAFAGCLDKLGIGICLNRFGVAVDPLAAIRSLKPVMVRLDDALVRDIADNRERRQAVGKLIRAVHHHRVKVAITRIEDLAWLPLLWELGVDYVQGACIQAPADTLDFVFPVEEEVFPNSTLSRH